MAIDVIMPKMGESITEGTILEWKKNIGDKIVQNDVFTTIEAVKTLADLFSPVSGEIIEVNDELENSPEMINSDCYKDGWIVKIKLSNESETSSLLSESEYKKLID